MADARREIETATSAELDKLAEIAPEDVERAKQSWRKHASPEFTDLLDAQPFEERGDAGA